MHKLAPLPLAVAPADLSRTRIQSGCCKFRLHRQWRELALGHTHRTMLGVCTLRGRKQNSFEIVGPSSSWAGCLSGLPCCRCLPLNRSLVCVCAAADPKSAASEQQAHERALSFDLRALKVHVLALGGGK